jgi:PAS domain-containing protein
MNVIFLGLMVTLGITYWRWRQALNNKNELEDIISHINRDVLIVVDVNRNVIQCNASVKRMFAYDVTDELGTILSLNTAMEKMCGSTREEVIGEHTSSFFGGDEALNESVMEKTAEMYEKGYAFYKKINA